MNYVLLINWFWENVPYRDGYKAHYGIVFFAVVDSINRNRWQKETTVDCERFFNKTKVEKRMYLQARAWLKDEELLTFIEGNKHISARFSLAEPLLVEVQKCTQRAPQQVPRVYPESTSTGTQSVPSFINSKQQTTKQEDGSAEPTTPAPSGKLAVKQQCREKVTLTEKELGKLTETHGKDKTDRLLDKLNLHKLSKGTVYKSDYHAILSWVIDAVDERGNRQRTGSESTRPLTVQPVQPNLAMSYDELLRTDTELSATQANRFLNGRNSKDLPF